MCFGGFGILAWLLNLVSVNFVNFDGILCIEASLFQLSRFVYNFKRQGNSSLFSYESTFAWILMTSTTKYYEDL